MASDGARTTQGDGSLFDALEPLAQDSMESTLEEIRARADDGEATVAWQAVIVALDDVRNLLGQIVSHEGHDRVDHCVEEMVGAARAALRRLG